MHALQRETALAPAALGHPAGVRELDSAELSALSGGMMAIPAVLVTALWIAGGIGAVAVVGIVIGVGVYAWTHKH